MELNVQLYSILWFILLIIVTVTVREVFSWLGQTQMFAEGYHWSQTVYRYAALLCFAALVHFHPWSFLWK